MKQKNLLKTSIELINKIEKENDEYFSRQMASYSKVFSELEDLKKLIQKAVNSMTDRQMYDKIYNLAKNAIEWHFQCEADDVSEYIATEIMNFLLKYKKTVSYIDLGDGNDR